MRILRDIVALLLIFALCGGVVFGLWYWQTDDSNDSKSEINKESALSTKVEGSLRKVLLPELAIDSVKDPIVTSAIYEIRERFDPFIEDFGYPLEIFVIDSPTVNAVCLPGGLVVVYAGLIRKMKSPEELAAVLAHEIAHAMNGDVMKVLVREVGIAALLVFTGTQGDALAVKIAHRLVSSGFSRKQETKADEVALRLLSSAGIDPVSLAMALRSIRQHSFDNSKDDKRENESEDESVNLLQYLNTHPDIDDRIKTIEAGAAVFVGEKRPFAFNWGQFRSRFRVLH